LLNRYQVERARTAMALYLKEILSDLKNNLFKFKMARPPSVLDMQMGVSLQEHQQDLDNKRTDSLVKHFWS
jgi:hypothetical protein